jgi:hypothetical protein
MFPPEAGQRCGAFLRSCAAPAGDPYQKIARTAFASSASNRQLSCYSTSLGNRVLASSVYACARGYARTIERAALSTLRNLFESSAFLAPSRCLQLDRHVDEWIAG